MVLAIGFTLPAGAAAIANAASAAAEPGDFEVTAWVRITENNRVTGLPTVLWALPIYDLSIGGGAL